MSVTVPDSEASLTVISHTPNRFATKYGPLFALYQDTAHVVVVNDSFRV